MTVWTKIIQPVSLETYLSKTGWRKIESVWRIEWADEVRCVHIPDLSDPDYNGLVKKVIHSLAEAEGREVADVFDDIFSSRGRTGVEILE